jgi:hypothetical protein
MPNSLREMGRMLRQAMTCRRCGGAVMVAATSWRGHGTGIRGESYYGATAHEGITPEKHCICPGGACWLELERQDSDGRWDEAFRLWEHQPNKDEIVIIWTDEKFMAVPLQTWREQLTAQWVELMKEGEHHV